MGYISYSDQYERFKQTGVMPAVVFGPRTDLNMKEEYRPITDRECQGIIEGMYSISNYGNIHNDVQCTLLKSYSNYRGDAIVSVRTVSGRTNIFVARIELLVFNYNPNYKNLQVNHVDGNPSNNILYNLEWTTPKENSDHAMLMKLHKMNTIDNPNNKLTEQQVHEICKLIQTGQYYDTEIAQMYGVSYTNISDIHKGKIWRTVSKDYDLGNRKPRVLTPEQVRGICELLQEGKVDFVEIGRRFGTSGNTVQEIKKGNIWKDISKDYVFPEEKVPRKFSKDQVREVCEVMQKGEYLDSEIAKMFGTTNTFLLGLRKGIIHRDVTKDYDMTIRKRQYQ